VNVVRFVLCTADAVSLLCRVVAATVQLKTLRLHRSELCVVCEPCCVVRDGAVLHCSGVESQVKTWMCRTFMRQLHEELPDVRTCVVTSTKDELPLFQAAGFRVSRGDGGE